MQKKGNFPGNCALNCKQNYLPQTYISTHNIMILIIFEVFSCKDADLQVLMSVGLCVCPSNQLSEVNLLFCQF